MENQKIEVIKIDALENSNKKLRVAAYARVSSDSEDQLNSYVSQVRYYTDLIKHNDKYEFVDIYADEGITGVSMEKRTDFQRMISDCKKGKIDKIITKSASRFSRNIVDSLNVVRELKLLGISVYFEKERIDTGDLKSENLLTLHSLMAQEESVTIAKNCKKGVRMRMSNGLYVASHVPYGYRLQDKKLVIFDEEAQIVKRIFSEYINGKGTLIIAKELMQDKIAFKNGTTVWSRHSVANILKNERYIGDKLFQKRYNEDVIPYKQCNNRGELPKYYLKNSHPAIIDRKDFELANKILSVKGDLIKTEYAEFPLSKKIRCKICNTAYRRKIVNNITYWVCKKHDMGAEYCNSQIISEESIYNTFIRMYNKLKSNYTEILIPMYSQLKKLQELKVRKNPKIAKINKEIADLLERNQVINALQTKGILDSAIFISQTNEINQKLLNLKTLKSKSINENNDDENLESTEELIYILKSNQEILDTFDETLFDNIVNQIYADNKEYMEFKLINGLIITERL